MEPFRHFAILALLRDAGFVTLAAVTLMVGFSFQLSLAFGIGANVAMIYALALILRASLLTPRRIARVEAWKHLRALGDPSRIPDPGRARDAFRDLLLRFAKTACGIAIVLSASSLALRDPYATAEALAPTSHAAVTMAGR
jgi:hypothetical protein